jgi:hypothetical protein
MYNRKVANAEAYITTLEGEVGPISLVPGIPKASASHLITLIDKVLRVRSGEEKPAPKPKAKPKAKAVSKPKPEPKKAEKKKVEKKVAPKKKVVAAKAKPAPAPKKKIAEKAKKK